MMPLPRLDGWPTRSPVNASPRPSRVTAHDSGSMWFATPSSWWTFTSYFLPALIGALSSWHTFSLAALRRSLSGYQGYFCRASDAPGRRTEPTVVPPKGYPLAREPLASDTAEDPVSGILLQSVEGGGAATAPLQFFVGRGAPWGGCSRYSYRLGPFFSRLHGFHPRGQTSVWHS